MEIRVTYSEYDKSIKEASIDFEGEGAIDLKFEDKVMSEVGCPEDNEELVQDEETGEIRIVKINTECLPPEAIKMLTIVAKDDTMGSEVANSVTHSDLTKVISLLQRMARQM